MSSWSYSGRKSARVCPKCKGAAQSVEDRIDIGIGEQVRLLGWDCPNCGLTTRCERCGVPEIVGIEHQKWCADIEVPT